MKLSPRAKLVAIGAAFLVPIVASTLAYVFLNPSPTANYGELVKPVPPPSQVMLASATAMFSFSELKGKWILVASDSGSCRECDKKLVAMRQVRLAMGRNADRVERVFVVDDGRLAPDISLAFPGLRVATVPAGMKLPEGAGGDRGHIYLIDPNGNVMMRWPADPDGKRMIRDLERLLKASQIG